MEARSRRWQGEGVDLELGQLELRHADLRICDPARRQRLIASLAELGQQVPVVVIAEPDRERERYVLIDGYQRAWALGKLGSDTVAATAWALPESEALLAHHHLCGSSRSALEEGWLLARLREQGLSLEDLARRMCRSKSWVSRRLALVGGLSAPVQARVRAGEIPPHAAMKHLVPLARANRKQCDAMCEALAGRVSVREVAALYEGWRQADTIGKERICADPALYLRAVGARAAEPGAANARTELGKDLSVLLTVAWRARQRIATDGLQLEVTYGRVELRAAWRAAKSAFCALEAALKEAWPDAGPEHADDHFKAP